MTFMEEEVRSMKSKPQGKMSMGENVFMMDGRGIEKEGKDDDDECQHLSTLFASGTFPS